MPSSPAPLKFWHQSMTELAGQGAYSRYLSSHARKILGDEVQVDVRGLRDGSYHGHGPPRRWKTPSSTTDRVCDQIIDNALQAEREGYAAFVIGSFSEPYLREIRSAVNITVASVLESSMLVACSLGKKTVAIANAPQIAFMVQAAIEKHGLSSRVLPVLRSIRR